MRGPDITMYFCQHLVSSVSLSDLSFSNKCVVAYELKWPKSFVQKKHAPDSDDFYLGSGFIYFLGILLIKLISYNTLPPI